MVKPSTPQRPQFFWQGAWIFLPVTVLALVSLISLHQDERSAEQDARNRAAENAQTLGRVLRSTVNEELQRYLALQNDWITGLRLAGQASVNGEFPDAKLNGDIEQWEREYPGFTLADLAAPQAEILANGRLIDPPETLFVPVPPEWFRELSPDQKRLWESLRLAAEAGGGIEAQQQAFLASHPSKDARRAALDLAEAPEQVAASSGALATETGIPFETIACYQLLSGTNARLTAALFQSVWWQIIDHPSMVSPKLLELAEGLTNGAEPMLRQKVFWTRQYWNCQSKTREWAGPLRALPARANDPKAGTPAACWTGGAAGEALALFEACTFTNQASDMADDPLAGPGALVWLAPREVIEAIFSHALAENRFLIPDYIRAVVSVEGKPLSPARSGHALADAAVVGTAAGKIGAAMVPDAADFELQFYLASREQMLAGERRRANLFMALVLGALFAAGFGLLAARRAFYRQWQLNELKSNFVSSVSHELRAPIAAVRLMAENLEGDKVSGPHKQREYFGFIVQECRRLSALVENVLDFARIEQGRKQYEFEPTDLVALTRTTVKLMEPYAAERGVKLEWPAGPVPMEHFELNVDGRAMQQALVNLIDNAIKHSAKGQVVTVGLENQNDSPKPGFQIYVADHGPGIPAAEQGKIFERFYRRGSELRRETQGVGIGLSIVKHIVEAHGGWVRVQSDMGRGSRFTIELPAKATP